MTLNYQDIYKEYQPKLRTLVSKKIKDKDYTDDLVQEILLKVYKNLDSYNPQYQLSTWIYTIAFNTLKNYYKSLRDNLTYAAEIYDNEHTELLDNPEGIMIAAETEAKFIKSLTALGENFVQMYMLKEVEGLSVKEIAAKHSIPEGTVKSRLKRARDYIKKEIL